MNQPLITEDKLPVHRVHTALFICLHACALLGVWFWPRPLDLLLFVSLYLTTCLGITVGYHRLLTHRSFKCNPWLRRMLTWMGAASMQNGPARWTAIHRRHHQAADLADDPHSPREGFFHAHAGWVLRQDKHEKEDFRTLVPDVSGTDAWMRILDHKQLFILPWVLTGILCYVVAGWRGVLWGTVIRTVWFWHVTWCVNSVCHWRGSRPYDTKDDSRNVWWVGLLTLGEGWHNNHHAKPSSALHGWRWYEVDISGYVIRLMARLGLVWKVVGKPH